MSLAETRPIGPAGDITRAVKRLLADGLSPRSTAKPVTTSGAATSGSPLWGARLRHRAPRTRDSGPRGSTAIGAARGGGRPSTDGRLATPRPTTDCSFCIRTLSPSGLALQRSRRVAERTPDHERCSPSGHRPDTCGESPRRSKTDAPTSFTKSGIRRSIQSLVGLRGHLGGTSALRMADPDSSPRCRAPVPVIAVGQAEFPAPRPRRRTARST